MRYRVRGLHRPTNKIVDITAEAPSQIEVLRRAEAKEITVVAIDMVPDASTAIVESPPVRAPAVVHAPAPVLQSGHVVGAPVVNVALPRRGSSLGVASLILGTLAFLICWVPLLGILGIPLSALGLLLGAIGFIVALTRGGAGIGYVIAGCAISGLALAVAGSQVAAIGALANAGNNPPPYGGTPAHVPADSAPNVSAAASIPALVPPQPEDESSTTPPASSHVGLGGSIELDSVRITLVSATIGHMDLKSNYVGGARSESVKPLVYFKLQLQNLDPNLKVEYTPFREDGGPSHGYASLADNFANQYKRIRFLGSTPEEASSDGAIYPGKEIVDVVMFEPPVANAEYVDLELPAERVGKTGAFKFRVPVANIQKRTSSR